MNSRIYLREEIQGEEDKEYYFQEWDQSLWVGVIIVSSLPELN